MEKSKLFNNLLNVVIVLLFIIMLITSLFASAMLFVLIVYSFFVACWYFYKWTRRREYKMSQVPTGVLSEFNDIERRWEKDGGTKQPYQVFFEHWKSRSGKYDSSITIENSTAGKQELPEQLTGRKDLQSRDNNLPQPDNESVDTAKGNNRKGLFGRTL